MSSRGQLNLHPCFLPVRRLLQPPVVREQLKELVPGHCCAAAAAAAGTLAAAAAACQTALCAAFAAAACRALLCVPIAAAVAAATVRGKRAAVYELLQAVPALLQLGPIARVDAPVCDAVQAGRQHLRCRRLVAAA